MSNTKGNLSKVVREICRTADFIKSHGCSFETQTVVNEVWPNLANESEVSGYQRQALSVREQAEAMLCRQLETLALIDGADVFNAVNVNTSLGRRIERRLISGRALDFHESAGVLRILEELKELLSTVPQGDQIPQKLRRTAQLIEDMIRSCQSIDQLNATKAKQ